MPKQFNEPEIDCPICQGTGKYRVGYELTIEMKQNFVDIYYRCIKMGDKRVMTVNRIISKLGITRKTFYNWIGKYGEPGRRSAPE